MHGFEALFAKDQVTADDIVRAFSEEFFSGNPAKLETDRVRELLTQSNATKEQRLTVAQWSFTIAQALTIEAFVEGGQIEESGQTGNGGSEKSNQNLSYEATAQTLKERSMPYLEFAIEVSKSLLSGDQS